MYKLLPLIFFIVFPRFGIPCSMVGGLPKIDLIYENTEYLFFGKVTEIIPSNSQGVFKVKFQVIENYRGAPDKEITVFSINGGDHSNSNGVTRISSCGCSFVLGSKHLMVVRASKKNDKYVPVGVPFKRTCASKTEISESHYPDAENNLLLWYFNERSKGLVPKYKSGREISILLRRRISPSVGALEFTDLFEYED